jgi:RNA polymerase sigma factor (sigma-70 family)
VDVAALPSIGRADRAGAAAPEADLTRALYERYAAQIFRYCLHQLGSREEAEDAVQSTFLNAFRGIKRGVLPEHESAWLFKIAENVCLSRWRSSWRRGRIESPADFEIVEELAPAPSRLADELVGLQDVLEQMPESQRRAILLREWQGLSYREIATELELSQAAVETLIFRARRSLAKGLEEPPAPAARRRAVRAGDLGNVLAGLKSLLLGGGAAAAKVAAVAAVVGAGTAVVASPPAHHARSHAPSSPAHAVTPAAPSVAPVAPASHDRAALPRPAAPAPPASAPVTRPASAPALAEPSAPADVSAPSAPAEQPAPAPQANEPQPAPAVPSRPAVPPAPTPAPDSPPPPAAADSAPAEGGSQPGQGHGNAGTPPGQSDSGQGQGQGQGHVADPTPGGSAPAPPPGNGGGNGNGNGNGQAGDAGHGH